MVKNRLPMKVDIRDAGSILGWEDPLEEDLQYSCLENPMHEELGVHRVSELDTTEAT